jgi:predicted trehalose synthase
MTKLEELRADRDAADACVVDAYADASVTKAAAWAALDVYATAKANYDAAYKAELKKTQKEN